MLGAGAGCTQLTAPLLLLLSPQWLSLSCSRSPSISPLSQQNLVIPSPGPAVRAVVAGGSLLCVAGVVVVVISCDVRAAHVAARDSTSGCIRARGDTNTTPRPLGTTRHWTQEQLHPLHSNTALPYYPHLSLVSAR